MQDVLKDPLGTAFFALGILFIAGFGILGLVSLAYLLFQWLRYRKREEYSLGSVVLQVAVPRDNELKIDVAEQLYSSIYSVKKIGVFSFIKPEDHISFELVARKEDIRFMVVCPMDLRDLIEKQIHGAYPGAEIKEIDEYNIFSEHGKVSFAQLRLKAASFYPLQNLQVYPSLLFFERPHFARVINFQTNREPAFSLHLHFKPLEPDVLTDQRYPRLLHAIRHAGMDLPFLHNYASD